MTTPFTVQAPAGYAPCVALAFGSLDGAFTAVDAANPLPVASQPSQAAATSTPLTGTASANATAGAFAPQLGRPIGLTLSGSWTGTVQLLRSTDGGTSKLPVTVGGAAWASFTGNCNEPVWEENDAAATFYLAFTLTSGSVTYRVAQ